MGLSKKIYFTEEESMSFTIWTTMYCNFNCRYCYETENKPSSFMSSETAKEVVDYIKAQAVKNGKKNVWINFHGGEPMLNITVLNELLDCFEADDNITYVTSMTTNGSIMDENVFNRINEITVSLDGRKESHDKNRITHNKEGTFDLIIDNIIKILKIKGDDVRLRMVLTPDNVDDLFENVKYLVSLGFKLIVPGIDLFNKNWEEGHFRNLYDQLIKLKNYREENWKEKDIKIAILDTPIKKYGDCSVGTDGFQIDVQGRLYHCMYVANNPEYSIGDIRRGIDENISSEVNCLNRKKPEECMGCTNQQYCEAQRCLLLNKLITGGYYTPSPVMCKSEWLKLKLNGVEVEL